MISMNCLKKYLIKSIKLLMNEFQTLKIHYFQKTNKSNPSMLALLIFIPVSFKESGY